MAEKLWQRRNNRTRLNRPVASFNSNTRSHPHNGLQTPSSGRARRTETGSSMKQQGQQAQSMLAQWSGALLVQELSAIRRVWKGNLESEFATIRKVVAGNPVVALKVVCSEAPVRPYGNFGSQYHQLKQQVLMTNILQLGLTFTDLDGGRRPECSVWHFNFHPSDDTSSGTGGRAISRNRCILKPVDEGIDQSEFAELLISSGIVLSSEITCVSFDSATDFGHLIQLLSGKQLPGEESEFMEMLKLYFPVTYDVKYLAKSVRSLTDTHSLNSLADGLAIANSHILSGAGLDSLMIAKIFHQMREEYFEKTIDQQNYSGCLSRLDTGPVLTSGSRDSVLEEYQRVEQLLSAALQNVSFQKQ